MAKSCIGRILSYVLVCAALWTNPSALRILLIGDSIDRIMVSEWCKMNRKDMTSWGEHSILNHAKNKVTRMPSGVCTIESLNVTLASLHVYGSSAAGPYLFVDTSSDQYAGTSRRIEKALEIFYQQFGEPDAVFFSSKLWDMRPFWMYGGLNESNSKFNETNAKMQSDVLDRLAELRRIIGPNVELGIRTSPYYDSNHVGYMMTAWNNIYREISMKFDLSLIDIDEDVWSIVQFNHSRKNDVMQDENHPKAPCLRAAAEKIVGVRYTSMYTRCYLKSNHIMSGNKKCYQDGRDYDVYDNKHFPFPLPFPNRNLSVKLVQALKYRNETLQYAKIIPQGLNFLHYLNDSTIVRWNNLNEEFLVHNLLGWGDVVFLNDSEIEQIPLMGDIPAFFNENIGNLGGIVTTTNISYLLHNTREVKRMPSWESLKSKIKGRPIAYHVDPLWLDISFLMGEPYHRMIKNNTLVRLQNERQIYLILEDTKHVIPSQGVFLKHGFDFANVVILKHPEILNDYEWGPDLD